MLTTALIVGVALAVALLASFVWPASPEGEAELVAGAVDVTGPVGRVGVVVTGPNTGGATDPTIQLPGAGPGDYTQRPGTGSITAPIGGHGGGAGEPRYPPGRRGRRRQRGAGYPHRHPPLIPRRASGGLGAPPQANTSHPQSV